ncbi:Uncharacterised protein [Mycobacteroides abscessus subsp. abscessus]|nr:Uncharacterised protein [Mycobacteroides abscessus subsp. abscessus]
MLSSRPRLNSASEAKKFRVISSKPVKNEDPSKANGDNVKTSATAHNEI